MPGLGRLIRPVVKKGVSLATRNAPVRADQMNADRLAELLQESRRTMPPDLREADSFANYEVSDFIPETFDADAGNPTLGRPPEGYVTQRGMAEHLNTPEVLDPGTIRFRPEMSELSPERFTPLHHHEAKHYQGMLQGYDNMRSGESTLMPQDWLQVVDEAMARAKNGPLGEADYYMSPEELWARSAEWSREPYDLSPGQSASFEALQRIPGVDAQEVVGSDVGRQLGDLLMGSVNTRHPNAPPGSPSLLELGDRGYDSAWQTEMFQKQRAIEDRTQDIYDFMKSNGLWAGSVGR